MLFFLTFPSPSAAVHFWSSTVCLWFEELSIGFTPIWTAHPFF